MASTVAGGAALFVLTALPVAALLSPTTALAQSQTGSLRIAVTGDDGLPLPGATVTVSSPDSLVSRSGVTDAEGRARLGGLDPATNYTVRVVASGYTDYTANNVAVVSGRDLSLGYVLVSGANSDSTTVEDVIVTGRSLAAVDVTSSVVGTTLTLQTMDALPTGRSYQSYLQLVPGVKPTLGTSQNPSSRSGVNYSDVGGAAGASTDNAYYLDGVDVTDPHTGTAGANFNSEIIQEQSVIVGGVPAEYAGGSGLISRVITKSGSNDWHGSINYYFQNDSLVAEDQHGSSGGFSTYDTAITFGGPIIRDRLWFFSSYQKRSREEEILNQGVSMRTVTNEADYAFGKLTWQVTDNDRLSALYFSDPTEISGSFAPTTPNNRDRVRTQGGDNYKFEYNRTWGDLLLNAYWFRHEGELTDVAADTTTRDDVAYLPAANSTLAQQQRGGLGADTERHKDREEWGISGEYFLDTGFGTHTFKAGYVRSENVYEENGTVPGDVTYESVAAQYAGVTFGDLTDDSRHWTTSSFVTDDIARIQTALALPANAAARDLVDTDNDNVISNAEVNAISFTNTAGNPYGNLNVARNLRTANGPYQVTSEGQAIYIQDTWTWDQLTVSAGLRAEKWEHFASDGSKTATFDWDLAPRLSMVYDLKGDGRSKLFGFVGRYYDPIRNNMSDFAGALTGPVDEEQINIGGQWVTFRTRGGATTPDALFSPTTKTPYTDEYMAGYSTTFGSSIGFSATVTHRATRDILEDFDLNVYSNPNNTTAFYASPGSIFYLPYSYFGYASKPNSNYVLGTLPGGKRDYTGLELVLTKYKTDDWFGQVSYTHNIAKGNTNSDSNADFQGDVVWLDPRAPNMYGKQAGNIPHQFKAYAGYEFDFGLEVSAVFNWNSGFLYTPASLVEGRYFAPRVGTAYNYGGVTTRWLESGFVASSQTPSYYTFDMRFKYVVDLPIGETELFLDVFNILNNQAAVDVQKLIAGDGTYLFEEANDWVEPRRAYLGVRYSF